MTLTPSGQAFVQHARRGLGQLEHLRSDLQEYAEGIKSHLRVWAGATAIGEVPATVPRSGARNGPQFGGLRPERKSSSLAAGVNTLEGQQQPDSGLSQAQTSGFDPLLPVV